MCLTETWHQPEVYSALNEACPPGYSYLEAARSTGRDHRVVSMELPFPSSHTKPKRQIHYRKLKNINAGALAQDLQYLSSGFTDSLSVADSVDFYNQSLSSLLDFHAPLISRSVSFTRSAPWYTCELRKMKTAGRVLERRMKASGLTVHKQAYREQKKAYAEALGDARSRFYSTIINNSPGNSKQ
ncbi:unnamed protein product [Leuciscus chuanchicus]